MGVWLLTVASPCRNGKPHAKLNPVIIVQEEKKYDSDMICHQDTYTNTDLEILGSVLVLLIIDYAPLILQPVRT